ncbi:MAG TPA: hypothetical protein VH369_08785 [Bryobacteraceae bacterium]
MRIPALPLAFLFCAGACFGAAPAIGTISGNAEVFEGSPLHTATSPSDLNLENGVTLRLAARSDGAVFSDHLVLKVGAVRAGNLKDYRIDAGPLQIEASDAAAQAVVRVTGKTIEVASIGGSLRVTDGGAMLTRVTAGTRVSFRQSGAQASPQKALPSDTHVMVWLIGITGAAALAIGLTAAAQGKSPF